MEVCNSTKTSDDVTLTGSCEYQCHEAPVTGLKPNC